MENMLHLILLMLFMLGKSGYTCLGQKLDITAFEYTRKFSPARQGFHLDLGECAAKWEEIDENTKIRRRCLLQPKTGLVRHVPKVANDTRNFEIRQIGDVFGCMSLCHGNAASSLGLLYDGDCFAVEIASNLTFDRKHYIRAYVEYYRQGVDVLQSDWVINSDLSQYYENQYFLRDRSYGSMEIIIVEMKFRRKRHVDIFRNSHVGSDHLSDYLEYADREIARPARIKIMRLSTADDKFEMQRFRRKQFEQAVNTVKRYELDINRIRYDIVRNYTKPHLNYGMSPYLQAPAALRRGQSSSDHLLWEKMTEAEVIVNHRLNLLKRIKRQCRKAKLPECISIRKIKRALNTAKSTLHGRRSKWNTSTEAQKSETNKILKHMRQANRDMMKLNKQIQLWRKQQQTSKRNSSKTRIKRGRRKLWKSRQQMRFKS